MNILFFINFLVAFAIFLFLSKSFLKNRKIEHLKKTMFSFFLVGLLYLILSATSFLWAFDFISYGINDFLAVYSVIILLQTVIFFTVISMIRKNKKILNLLFLYVLCLSSFLIHVNFFYLILIFSFSLTLILFLIILSIPHFEKISNLAIFYSSLSLLFQISLVFKGNAFFGLSIVSNAVFLAFLYFFMYKIEFSPSSFFEPLKKEVKQSYFLDFLKYFIFIIVLTNFVFIATISVHEVGHLASSKAFSCDYGKIVYEGGLPRTEILCADSSHANLITMGGILLPILLAILLIFSGGTFMKEIALLVIGFDLIISYQDLLDMGISKTIPVFITIFGILFVVFAISLLAKSRTSQNELSYFEK